MQRLSPIISKDLLVYLDMCLSRVLTTTGTLFISISLGLLLYTCASSYKIANNNYSNNRQRVINKPNKPVVSIKEDYQKGYKASKKIHKWLTPTKWKYIYKYSTINGISPGLTAALIWHESEGKEWAKGPYIKGQGRAYGLMQIIPKYHYRGDKNDLLDPETNIKVGTKILARYIKRESGNLTRALKDYNSGPGSRYYNKRYINGILKQYREYQKNLAYEMLA
jgi:soluble lytic murein transglycosylase-like protein